MKNRLYDYIYVFVVLEILQSSICYAKIINDTCRTKREISIVEIPQSKGDDSYAREINLEHEEQSDDDLEEDGTYQDDAKEKRNKVSRKAADSMISADFHPSNAEESDRDNMSNYFNSRRSNEGLEETEEADEEVTKRERAKNEEASNLVRLPRNINSDLDKYTDLDERSSLYDDYEAKDVAKRGILNGEDYEEMEDDFPRISEDMAAVHGSTNEAEKRETRKDARVKRDQAEISEMLDKSKSSLDDPAKLEESKTAAENPYSREVSRIELSKSFNEASAPDNASKIEGFGAKDVISKSSGSSKIEESASITKRDDSNAEYEKRVEEEIQRKIDSIKEEIRRDIEAQQRVRNIEDNNAKFDELQDEELEDNEERQNFKDDPIEKRQTLTKRSLREIADDVAASSKRNEEKRSSRKKQHRQPRSGKISGSDTSKENENLKKRFVANHDKSSEQTPAKGLVKEKRERVRQIFLVNNQPTKRQLRSHASPADRTAVRSESELFMNPDSRMDNRMFQASLPIGSEDENNEGEQNPTAEHADSLVSLTGSSQELSPHLEKEYKEAFGGLQSESGSALARFKRIKRVLASPNAKI